MGDFTDDRIFLWYKNFYQIGEVQRHYAWSTKKRLYWNCTFQIFPLNLYKETYICTSVGTVPLACLVHILLMSVHL